MLTGRVIDKIARDINRPFERIGLLMGTLEDQALWINEIIAAETERDTISCVFPADRLAKVANDILEGRITGRIVGWYHSHPGHGLFLSQTDIDTHMQFYQFSSYAVSLVADPTSEEFGVWIYENGTGIVQLPANYLHII
ncbi:MAG TPA: Mov34/MPN/PAD-1 family protein [Candidatus Bathyarchaeia archaeon]|nr:Mov34/MPN/PAD-1 family protein [Candidatus Bathyarchaeia archaeon]